MVSRRGSFMGFLDDNKASWLETWMTTSYDSIISDVIGDLINLQESCPNNFVLISLNNCVQKGVVLQGGTWRTYSLPDQRHGGQEYTLHHEWLFMTQRKLPWKFCLDIICFGLVMLVCYHGNKTWDMENECRPKNHFFNAGTKNIFFQKAPSQKS